jgi:hypothetical protein
MYCREFISRRSSGLSPPSRSYPPLRNTSFTKCSRFRRGSRWVAICLQSARLKDWHQTHLEEDDCETSLISGLDSQSQVSDWKETTKDHLGVASRFMQMLIKRVPGCISTNPIVMAFSIAKSIIEIKDVGCCLFILGAGWLLYQTIGDNKDKLAQLLSGKRRCGCLPKQLMSRLNRARPSLSPHKQAPLLSHLFGPIGSQSVFWAQEAVDRRADLIFSLPDSRIYQVQHCHIHSYSHSTITFTLSWSHTHSD